MQKNWVKRTKVRFGASSFDSLLLAAVGMNASSLPPLGEEPTNQARRAVSAEQLLALVPPRPSRRVAKLRVSTPPPI